MSQISVKKRIFSREKGKARAFLYIIVSLCLSPFSPKREREKEKSVRAEMRKSSSLFFVGKKEKREKREKREKSIQLTQRAQNTKKAAKNNEISFKHKKKETLTVYPTRRFRRVSS
jgi:hypothetical protein